MQGWREEKEGRGGWEVMEGRGEGEGKGEGGLKTKTGREGG